MAAPYSPNRVDALKRMLGDACKLVDEGHKEEGFVSLLHTASAAIDRLQLLGSTCFTAKQTDNFEAATKYLSIIRQATLKLDGLLADSESVPLATAPKTGPLTSSQAEIEAALQAVVDAINSAAGPFEVAKNNNLGLSESDDPNSPTTATQPLDVLPKFELVVTNDQPSAATAELLEKEDSKETVTEAVEPVAKESTGDEDLSSILSMMDIEIPRRATSLQAGSSMSLKKNHLEVDTESAKKKLDKRTSHDKLADVVADALEQLSEARSPADDWVLAGSPSVSQRSLLSSRQVSSSAIIRKPKVLPQVADVKSSPVEPSLLGERLLDFVEDPLLASLEAAVSLTDVMDADGLGEDKETIVELVAELEESPSGPWADLEVLPTGSITSLAAISEDSHDSPVVIPARGQSLSRNPIHPASDATPPQRRESLRLVNGSTASQSLTMRRSASSAMGRSMSQASTAGFGSVYQTEALPTTIIEAQTVNTTIWKEYQTIIKEFKDRSEPVPADLAVTVMQTMIQNYAAARDHWERTKIRRSATSDLHLPTLPRKLSSKVSPGTFRSPVPESTISDVSSNSPQSTESGTTVVAGRSPGYELTPSGLDDGMREEHRLKREAACNMIVREIYETELGFKDSMRVLTESLGQQMRSASAQKDPMISRRDVETIFKYTPDLVSFSAQLSQEFKTAVERYPQDPTIIGNVFANHVGDFEIFIHFVTNYSRAKATIRRYEDISPAFKKFLLERQDSPECKKQDIHSFLIMPIQRAMRYYLLLSTLLKKMEPNSEAYPLIESACMFMNEISQAMNRMQQQEEEINGLFDMHRLVEHCPDTILSSSRRFEKAFICEDMKKQKHVKAFVLSDLVIFTRIKKESKDDYDFNASLAKDKEALAKGKRRYQLKEMCFIIDVRLVEPLVGDDGTILRLKLVNPFRVGNDGRPKVAIRRTSTRSKRRTIVGTDSQSRGRWSFGGKPAAEPESSDDEVDNPSETSTRQSSPARNPNARGGTMRTIGNRTSVVIDDSVSVMEMEDDGAEIVSLSLKFPDCLARDDMVRLIADLQGDGVVDDGGEM